MKKRTPDIYDREVARLTRNPGDIGRSWCNARPLFAFLGDGYCGCPTMIKSGEFEAALPSVTKAVRHAAIPTRDSDIKPKHLLTFARLQRLADKLIGRRNAEGRRAVKAVKP